jgi:nucleoside-diphosphate-sugar epimerase
MKSALITGGAGFVGSHLARRLLDDGVETHLVVRPGADLGRVTGLRSKAVFHEISSSDEAALTRCFAQASPEAVFHLASQTRASSASPIDDAEHRIGGDLGFLLKIASAAALTAEPPLVLVRAATLAEYGAAAAPYRESDRLQPLTPYGASMAACTLTLSALRSSLPYRVAQGRLALVYGPGQSLAFLVAKLIAELSAGRPVDVRNPSAQRDLIFIDDAVDGLIALAARDIGPADTANLCTGTGVSMREAAETVRAATGAPASLVKFGDVPISDGAQDLWGSPDFAAEALQWRAKTNFKNGVRLTLERSR